MCGRFLLEEDINTIERFYGKKIEDDFPISGEKFPGTNILVFDKAFRKMHWGIYLLFFKRGIINARIEKIKNRGFFYEDFKSRRCLVPSTAFYEWDQTTKVKYKIFSDEPLFSLAGIYRLDEKQRLSVSLLTTNATGSMEKIHSREPIIIKKDSMEEYLNSTNIDALIDHLVVDQKLYLKRLDPKQETFL